MLIKSNEELYEVVIPNGIEKDTIKATLNMARGYQYLIDSSFELTHFTTLVNLNGLDIREYGSETYDGHFEKMYTMYQACFDFEQALFEQTEYGKDNPNIKELFEKRRSCSNDAFEFYIRECIGWDIKKVVIDFDLDDDEGDD